MTNDFTPLTTTYRAIVAILLLLNVLAGCYLAYEAGTEREYQCSGFYDCEWTTHFSPGKALLALIAPAISIFILFVILRLIDYGSHLEERVFYLERKISGSSLAGPSQPSPKSDQSWRDRLGRL